MSTQPPLIEVKNLKIALEGQEILRDFSLDVYEGETLVLLGKSGGGKSVFLRQLIGLIKPDEGQIFFRGEDIVPLGERQLEPIRERIGMMFQDGALFDSMDVFDNVAFPARERGEKDAAALDRRVRDALAIVNMLGHEHKMPAELSGGMRKRVALARAVICVPQVLLYDEPTAGLDPIISDSINKLIRHLQSELHVTSIVVTHDMTSCFHIADRVALLHEGRCYFAGSLEELRACRDPIVKDFIEGRSATGQI